MEKNVKSGYRTLLMSVLLSSPGPLVLGLGLTVGRSSTQLADFARRTAELLALITAFAVYGVTIRRENMDTVKKRELERKGNLFSGTIMCLSGLIMLLLAIFGGSEDKGNVLPALIIAFLGVVTNVFFWRKYTVLHRTGGNSILGVQARLYGAKSAVDICVTLALVAVLTFPGTKLSFYIDSAGSVFVSLYMLRCGLRTIAEQRIH